MNKVPDEAVIAATRTWVERAVIGLNLCPFAKVVHVKNQIRYVLSRATTQEALLKDLMEELEFLAGVPAEKTETTLLIHPDVLNDFLDYNDFLDVVDAALEDMDLEGEIQVATFHPHYQFVDTQPNDIENFTNRSPYPMLQLLRESSVVHAVSIYPEASKIFDKNIETIRKLGRSGWNELGLNELTPPAK